MHKTITGVTSALLVASALLLGAIIPAWAAPDAQATPISPVMALVAVERAVVFPEPDRNTSALTYVYERERLPVLAQHIDGVFLLIAVGQQQGWVLRAQVDLEGELALIPVIAALDELPAPGTTPALTPTPARASRTAAPQTPTAFPTRTPLPTRAAIPGVTPTPQGTPAPTGEEPGAMQVFPGVLPPLTIALPDGWEQVNLVVPMRTFDDEVRDIPLTIYFGELDPGVVGLIYLYWGYPNTVDWASGEYNLWADGVQILRGSLVGQDCNLGVYDQQVFTVGDQEGVGASYQSSNCTEEADTAGWFAALRVNGGSFAFFTAVEPWDALADYRPALQAILDSVEFLPIEEASP